MSDKMSSKTICVELLLLIASIAKIEATGLLMEETYQSQVLVKPMLQFGSKLMLEVDREKENVIFSPASIHCSLNLLLLGSKEGSNTEKELLRTLGYGDRQDNRKYEAYKKLIEEIKHTTKQESGEDSHNRPPRLDIWSMALVNERYEKPQENYLDAVKKYYSSDVRSLNQQQSIEIDKLVKEINGWGTAAGFGSEIINSNDLKKDFSLILLNAVRVEAFWFDDFFEFQAENIFYNQGLKNNLVKNGTCLSNGDIRGHFLEFKADIVSGKIENQRYETIKTDPSYKKLSELDFYAIQVPLQGDVSFVCLVPSKMNGDGKDLLHLEDELMKEDGESNLDKVLDMLDQHPAEIQHLRLPKFRFEEEFELNKPLKALGLESIFDEDGAELSKISSSTKLFISEVKHHAMIEVNKVGLRAAGVTMIRVVPTSLKINPRPIRVEIDRPFLFLVRYKHVPLFMGHLMKI